MLSQADLSIVADCISSILQNHRFKAAITPDVAINFLRSLTQLMLNKHSTYVKSAMYSINDIVNLFK
jgi:hypothetical protein